MRKFYVHFFIKLHKLSRLDRWLEDCQYANQGKDAAFLSDALSIELPSDAARALSVKIAKPRHCCTIGEAYPSSAVSIEFPVETAKLYLS